MKKLLLSLSFLVGLALVPVSALAATATITSSLTFAANTQITIYGNGSPVGSKLCVVFDSNNWCTNPSTTVQSDGTWSAALGSFTGAGSNPFQVRVENPTGASLTNGTLIITSASTTSTSSITVTSPNGGESWQKGTTHNINYSLSDWIDQANKNHFVGMKLFKNSVFVSSVGPMISIGPYGASGGSLAWTIPTSLADGSAIYTIQATEYAPDGTTVVSQDSSDAAFTITGTTSNASSCTLPDGTTLASGGTTAAPLWWKTSSGACFSAPFYCNSGALIPGVQFSPMPEQPVTGQALYMAETACLSSSSGVKLFVSNALDGPWTQNGSASNDKIVYLKTTGLDKAKTPWACITPHSAHACDTYVPIPETGGTYRTFTNSEWNGTTDTVITYDGPGTGAGTYDVYVYYDAATGVRKYGSVTVTGHELFVSSTPIGPWGPETKNGSVRTDQDLYVKTTGLDKSKSPKGCVDLVGATGCDDNHLTNYRFYTENEWIDATTVITHAPPTPGLYAFPVGTYASYIYYPGTAAPVKVGTFTVTAATSNASCTLPDGSTLASGSATTAPRWWKTTGGTCYSATFYCNSGVLAPGGQFSPMPEQPVTGQTLYMTETACNSSANPLLANVKVYVANTNTSAAQWVKNGSVHTGESAYLKTTGLDKSKTPWACITRSTQHNCDKYIPIPASGGTYRTFTANEWVDGGTTTVVTHVGPGTSVGTYNVYVYYPGMPITEMQPYGSVTVTASSEARTCFIFASGEVGACSATDIGRAQSACCPNGTVTSCTIQSKSPGGDSIKYAATGCETVPPVKHLGPVVVAPNALWVPWTYFGSGGSFFAYSQGSECVTDNVGYTAVIPQQLVCDQQNGTWDWGLCDEHCCMKSTKSSQSCQ